MEDSVNICMCKKKTTWKSEIWIIVTFTGYFFIEIISLKDLIECNLIQIIGKSPQTVTSFRLQAVTDEVNKAEQLSKCACWTS